MFFNHKYVIFKHILVIDILSISGVTALSLKTQNLIDDKLTSIQAMVCCRQATDVDILMLYGIARE